MHVQQHQYAQQMQMQQQAQKPVATPPNGPVGAFTGVDGRVYEYEQNRFHDLFMKNKVTLLTAEQQRRLGSLKQQEVDFITRFWVNSSGHVNGDRRAFGKKGVAIYMLNALDFLESQSTNNACCLLKICCITSRLDMFNRSEVVDIVKLLKEFDKENSPKIKSGEYVPFQHIFLDHEQLKWFLSTDKIWLQGAKHF